MPAADHASTTFALQSVSGGYRLEASPARGRRIKLLHYVTQPAQMIRCVRPRAAELTQIMATNRRPTSGAGPPPSSHALTGDALPPPPFPPLPPIPAAFPLKSACCLLLKVGLRDDNAFDRLGAHRRQVRPVGDSRLAAHCRMQPLCMHASWRALELNSIFYILDSGWQQRFQCAACKRIHQCTTALPMRLVAEDATKYCSMGSDLSGPLLTGTQGRPEPTASHKQNSLSPAVAYNTEQVLALHSSSICISCS